MIQGLIVGALFVALYLYIRSEFRALNNNIGKLIVTHQEQVGKMLLQIAELILQVSPVVQENMALAQKLESLKEIMARCDYQKEEGGKLLCTHEHNSKGICDKNHCPFVS